jgi:hypothetical protein
LSITDGRVQIFLGGEEIFARSVSGPFGRPPFVNPAGFEVELERAIGRLPKGVLRFVVRATAGARIEVDVLVRSRSRRAVQLIVVGDVYHSKVAA